MRERSESDPGGQDATGGAGGGEVNKRAKRGGEESGALKIRNVLKLGFLEADDRRVVFCVEHEKPHRIFQTDQDHGHSSRG